MACIALLRHRFCGKQTSDRVHDGVVSSPEQVRFDSAQYSVPYSVVNNISAYGTLFGRVLNNGDKRSAVIWVVQLVFNFLWSILFFTMRMPLWGFVDILLLDASVICFMLSVSKKDKPSLYMFIPYILWLVIATYLNGYILINN